MFKRGFSLKQISLLQGNKLYENCRAMSKNKKAKGGAKSAESSETVVSGEFYVTTSLRLYESILL